ncbi:MAG: N-acetylmuramoyl-L-alanine amidase AmiC precursor [Pelotomaculum sp. PtaB.Bin013]|uniref:N-acetylmuramoyl-L-alanine amidase n=1 Tax=Pelotomaculum isophthalicicum JI TaxID=947010 RepID=A0A9X4H2T6_9FIRM|nr:N-acetylmuramoyl-L-alanine amidase [Pelotomaculum isophthalicicum]MDF9409105.1 N-acetylmuramoyl-L-alanine amidase [Pelotomaculum isophthalicicum JI]OPX89962.1 MAG: N-acetylmuramoyl-L-alanine amidase AmiC precursor [Pelotomaculum sp. PtaB.Bin013]
MSKQKAPRITNMWSKIVDEEKGEWLTKVVLESTKPYKHGARNADGRVIFEGEGVILNMPGGTTEVNDGLLRELIVKQNGKKTVSVEMMLEHPAEFRLTDLKGFPFRVEIALNRSSITKLFSGKKIVIDPGHGGEDTGGKGPVSLQEKDVVIPIAKKLENILRRVNADVVLTRNGDENITREKRFALVKQTGADVYIGVHNRSCDDSNEDGVATLYAPANKQSAILARYVQEGLVNKLKAADRGTAEQAELAAIGGVPAIEAEVLTITNLVEEVFLRGLTVQKRAAEGIFNGLIKYFAQNGANSKGDYS